MNTFPESHCQEPPELLQVPAPLTTQKCLYRCKNRRRARSHLCLHGRSAHARAVCHASGLDADQQDHSTQVQRAAAMSGDLTKPEDVVPFIVFLATDGELVLHLELGIS